MVNGTSTSRSLDKNEKLSTYEPIVEPIVEPIISTRESKIVKSSIDIAQFRTANKDDKIADIYIYINLEPPRNYR